MVTDLKFGAVASADSYNLLQPLTADRKAMLNHNLSPKAFCITFVDNIEVQQSQKQIHVTDSHKATMTPLFSALNHCP